jgi:magnesium chelatase subunit I
MQIMDMERKQFAEAGIEVFMPPFMREIVAEITHLGRKSPDINQRSGVSVRISIMNYETIVANAVRRAVLLGEKIAVPRISDLPFIYASMGSKIELEGFEEAKEGKIIDALINRAILNVFNRHAQGLGLEPVTAQFTEGFAVEVSDIMPAKNYARVVKEITGFNEAIKKIVDSEKPEIIAATAEYILEGLHVNKRLNKTKVEGKSTYKR